MQRPPPGRRHRRGRQLPTGGVSTTPANGTPQLVLANRKGTEKVRQLVKCGNLIYAVGDFKTITQAGHTHTRNGIFSFSATAPYTLSKMLVGVNGQVNSIAFTSAPRLRGRLHRRQLHLCARHRATNIAEINTSTGGVVKSFGRNANSTVHTLLGYQQSPAAGGTFTCINGYGRNYYASLNPFTGKDDGFARLKHLRPDTQRRAADLQPADEPLRHRGPGGR